MFPKIARGSGDPRNGINYDRVLERERKKKSNQSHKTTASMVMTIVYLFMVS